MRFTTKDAKGTKGKENVMDEPMYEPGSPPTRLIPCAFCDRKIVDGEDMVECEDCGKMMCDHCYYDESDRYGAVLCADCAYVRDPDDAEVMQAFTFQCMHLYEYLTKEYRDEAILKTALAEIVDRILMMYQEPPSEFVQKHMRAEIRRLPIEDRPWRRQAAQRRGP